jgi:hypothetical protein
MRHLLIILLIIYLTAKTGYLTISGGCGDGHRHRGLLRFDRPRQRADSHRRLRPHEHIQQAGPQVSIYIRF